MKKSKGLKFTHLDDRGTVSMVDVGCKQIQQRVAIAQGKILLASTTIKLIRGNKIKKGGALNVAQVAGIQAAKVTSQLIPLCHPLILDHIEVKFEIRQDGVMATSKIQCQGRTGVEMEALTAVNIALLTIYDMCKAVDKSMRITDICLLSKVKNNVK